MDDDASQEVSLPRSFESLLSGVKPLMGAVLFFLKVFVLPCRVAALYLLSGWRKKFTTALLCVLQMVAPCVCPGWARAAQLLFVRRGKRTIICCS